MALRTVEIIYLSRPSPGAAVLFWMGELRKCEGESHPESSANLERVGVYPLSIGIFTNKTLFYNDFEFFSGF